jgi:hypothetical protein
VPPASNGFILSSNKMYGFFDHIPGSEWIVFKTRVSGHLKTRATVSAGSTQHPPGHGQGDV